MTTQLTLADAPVVDPHAGERDRIAATIAAVAARHGGRVSTNDVREALRGSVDHPRLVGQVYRALRQRGVLVEAGAERSTDVAGGNAGRWVPVYDYVSAP
jgi:hypothetical protein